MPNNGNMQDNDDDTLMQRVKNGDSSAFDELVIKWQNDLYCYIYKILRDHHWAEDARQEIFIRVYLSAKKYKPSGKFRAWLYKTASNHCKNELKKRKRSPFKLVLNVFGGKNSDAQNPSNNFVDPNPQPLDNMVQAQNIQTIRAVINNLPNEQRIVIEKYYYEHLNCREISEILGCPQRTVESRRRYALEKLRDALK